MSLPQKTYTDYKHLGDTGNDDVASIQPLANGEVAGMTAFRRPSENLRSRTELVRSYQDDLLYYRDRSRYVLDVVSPGVLSWGGTVALGGNGQVDNTTLLTARPLSAVNTNLKGVLTIGTVGVNAISYTVAAGAYATDGMNEITVEHRDVSGTLTPTCVITAGPIKRILVVFDSADVSQDSAAVIAVVAPAIAADTVLNTRLTLVDSGVPGTAILVMAETAIDTKVHAAGTAGQSTADAEAHTLTANALGTFTTSRPLIEGDVLAIRYDYVIEPLGGDPDDPKAGVAGGREESNVARGNASVVANLFVAADSPQWLPGAIPLVKIVQNVAVWIDGTHLIAGTTGAPGTAIGSYIDGSVFSGNPTLIINGGIDTAVTTIQAALVSVDARLGQHRYSTYVVTDGSASTGGTFNASTGLNSALSALGGSAGTIKLRRGSYVLSTSIPAGTVIEGEGVGLVTVTLTANTAAGANSKISDITVGASGFILSTAGRIEAVAGAGFVTLLAGASANCVSVSSMLVSGAGVRVNSFTGKQLSLGSGSHNFAADGLILAAATSNVNNLSVTASNNVSFRNVAITGGPAQTSADLFLTVGACSGIRFDGLNFVRADTSTGAMFALSATTTGFLVDNGVFTLTRGLRFVSAFGVSPATSNRIVFRKCVFTAPAANTDTSITGGRFFTDDLVLEDCSVTQGYNSYASIYATNLTATRCIFTLAWGKVASLTAGIRLGAVTPGQGTFTDCTFINGNPVQGGYTPIYGEPSGGGCPLIDSLSSIRMVNVDFSTSAEVENSGATSNPDFTKGIFLDVARLNSATHQAPIVYLENTGFFTSMPRHVNFSSDPNGCFFRCADVSSGTASGLGRSRVEIVGLRTAAQPGSSVQAGTESLEQILSLGLTDIVIRDTLDYTAGTGGFTYSVYPTYYMNLISSVATVMWRNVHCKFINSPMISSSSAKGGSVVFDGCTCAQAATTSLPITFPRALNELRFTNCDFLNRGSSDAAGFNFAVYPTRTTWNCSSFRRTDFASATAVALITTTGITGTVQISHCLISDANASRTASEVFSASGTAICMGTGNIFLSAGTDFTQANLALSPAASGSYVAGSTYFID